jgi:hypothetical protein
VGVGPPTVTVTVSTEVWPPAVVMASSPPWITVAVLAGTLTVMVPSFQLVMFPVRSTEPILSVPRVAPKP